MGDGKKREGGDWVDWAEDSGEKFGVVYEDAEIVQEMYKNLKKFIYGVQEESVH